MIIEYLVQKEADMWKTVAPPIDHLFTRPIMDEEGNELPVPPRSWEEMLDAMQLENNGGRGYIRTKEGVEYRVMALANPRHFDKGKAFEKGNMPQGVLILSGDELNSFGFDTPEEFEPLN